MDDIRSESGAFYYTANIFHFYPICKETISFTLTTKWLLAWAIVVLLDSTAKEETREEKNNYIFIQKRWWIGVTMVRKTFVFNNNIVEHFALCFFIDSSAMNW